MQLKQILSRTALAVLTWCALPSQAQAAADSVVVFSEIHYHPRTAGETEWIELHSLQGANVDVSGWRLEGGVEFTFPNGTVIPGGGYVVIAANTALIPGAMGPFSGTLDNKGEDVRLLNNSGRVMDEVSYSDGGDWPTGPDGSGATLVKINEESADSGPSRWTTSQTLGGTPGARNFPAPDDAPQVLPLVGLTSTWKYLDNNTAPPAAWKTVSFDDAAWESGEALLFAGDPDVSTAGDGLYGYWPLEETGGTTAPNVAPGGTAGTLFTGATWTTDATRGKVLSLNGSGGYVSAGSLPMVAGEGDFTISFWANSQESGSSSVVLGNRYSPTGGDWNPREFFKFTPSSLEFHRDSAGENIDYSDFSMNVWQHHTVVKTGSTLTYYRNGTVAGSRAISGPLENVQPLYFGGDKAQESWAGKLDDVAIWTKALPIPSVEGLADGSYTPLTAPTGSVAANLVTEVAEGPVTHYFRRKFNFTAAKARTTLTLQHSLDDGAVFYLNGTEVHRVNLPEGAITHTTPAVAPVGHAALSTEITIPTTALVVGENVLTVEVHQHSADPDMLFGASLVASVEPAPPRFPGTGLVFNEISGAGDPQFKVELINLGGSAVDLAGYQLVSSSGAVGTLTGGSVAPGALLVIDAAQLGFTPLAGDKLFLLQPGGVEFEDAQEVTSRLRGRAEGWNRTWLFPSGPSFGAANAFTFNDSVVINELMYNPHQQQVAQEQWVELFNRGTGPVDLTGWSFSEGITYVFPAGTILAPGAYLVITSSPADFAQNHPGVTALGPFTGKLAGSGERVTLRDASGNPADQVRYFDAGRWDDLADGGGSSLERRNAFAASTSPENWAGSDETGRSEWQTITYSGSGANVGTNVTQWHEFVFGLLSKGSFLIDDISVIESPTGARIQLIQNGDFSSGQNTWRLLGTHRRGTIVDDNGNPALRVDASGFTEHMHNHVETTLKNGASYVTLSPSKQYEISFRAKWLGGNNLLNTRLYFNRLPRTTALPVSPKGGTPGAVNSRNTSNLGPTYQGLTHSPAVPQAGQAATVSVRPSSPVGLGGLTLFHRLDGGAFSQVPMSDPDGDGVFSGTIPPQTAGARVQFYVQATDTAANTSFFPAAGPESRALIPWYNGEAGGGAAANFRIVMLTEDSDFLHTLTQVMSDDARGATVIYRENEIYYDVGVRLKGSQRGRGSNVRVGWHLRFPPHDAFLGAHITMTIDRSGAGDQFSQKEILVIHALNRAGNIPGSYDDLVRVIAPRAVHTGSAMMQKARFSDVFLDGQWDNGADGPMFEYELIYYPTTTQGGSVEGLKLPQPDNVVGTAVTGLGANREAYRWHYLQKNNRQADNYATIMAAATAMGLPSGTQFINETRAKLDVDQWLRAFAIQQLFGIGDSYAVGGQHNAVFYTRPTDGKTLYFPKDMDFTFSQGATSGIAAGDLSKLIADGANRRAYYGHLLDIIDRSFNTTYMGPWAQHYTSFLEGENLTVWMSYINQRSNYVRSQVNGAIPQVAFNVTTNGGQPLTVATSFATLQGTGWVNVREIRLAGSNQPLEVTWLTDRTWRVNVPVPTGTKTITLQAIGFDGSVVGTTSITVTSTASTDWPAVRINEFMASNQSYLDPADNDADDWVELYNPTAAAVSLAGWQIADGSTNYFIPNGYSIPAGGYLLVWADEELAQNTGSGPLHVPFKLSASGETITLRRPDGSLADEVLFGPQGNDMTEGIYPDGGAGLHALTLPSPGAPNVLVLSSVEREGNVVTFTFTTTPGVRYQPQVSEGLADWAPLGPELTATGDTLAVQDTVGAEERKFYRVQVVP